MTLQRLLEFLFPPQCGGCELPGTGACERCLPYGSGTLVRLQTLAVDALGSYEGNLRRAVLALKSGRRDVARSFAERLCDLVCADDAIVPVPTTAARKRERGFDGCLLMAQMVASSIPVTVHANLRQIAGDRQRGRGREARLCARGRFSWIGEAPPRRRILLLDDVMTTGATLEDCAAAVRAAGGSVEHALVVARA